ncbi:MAG: hypothetical protein JXC33_07910 [Deltaproteobacteria bacterium]|nr:hypothetical protein [Deltaproteobacteria bacterium]
MVAIFKIALVALLVGIGGDAYALTDQEGQYLFDSIFWLVMSTFCLGLTAGLAIKLINRS